MSEKKIRETLSFFATGVIIACARKKNFFNTHFFNKTFFEKKNILKKVEDFWVKFLHENPIGKNLEKKFYNKNFLEKIKNIFADEFFGITINSFSSISLEPALISFCIDNKSSNLKLFKRNKYFSLNILSEQQQELAGAFATPKNSTKWGVEPYTFGRFGNPIFQNSLTFIECEKHKVIKMGDHHIIVGKIVDFGKINEKQSPLLYYKSKFNKI